MDHNANKANLLRERASTRLDAGRLEDALTAADAAIDYAARSLRTREGIDAQAFFDWALGFMMRGVILRHIGRYRESKSAFDQADMAMRSILQEFPMDENLATHAQILNNRGLLSLVCGDGRGAVADLTEAIDIRRPLIDRVPEQRDLLAGSLKNRSGAWLGLWNLPAALADAEEAVKIRSNTPAATRDPRESHMFAMTLYSLALVYVRSGRRLDARAPLSKAIQVLSPLLKSRPRSPALDADMEMCRALAFTLNG